MSDEKGVFIKQMDMMVAAKIVQLVASGIYRTPANALKELISNSFDADATKVDIQLSTNAKESGEHVIVEDNGTGIDQADFEFSINHIGVSPKRDELSTTPLGRPVIGRIGIGMLSVGQASNTLDLRSATRNGLGIRAEIDLSPYYDAVTMAKSLNTLKIGNVKLFRFENPSKKTFTRIALRDLKPPFRQAVFGNKGYKMNFDFSGNSTYKDFVEWLDVKKIKRLDEISPFNRFMFELGLLSPVRYLQEGPVKGYKSFVVSQIKERLDSYNFHVYVNNIEIFKPILFPHVSDNLGALAGKEPYKIYEKELNTKLGDRTIVAKCYYYHQDVRVLPYELRGILIRVKNVGIGTYENRFSKIASESPVILQQLTGELYVDEGLDEALNIDRNSFFESDEAYQRLWLEILAWVNPDQIPDDASDQVKRDANPVTRDIRGRLDSIRVEKKNRKEKKQNGSLIRNLAKVIADYGYPAKSMPKLRTMVDPQGKMRVRIQAEGEHTDITISFDRNYPGPIRNLLVLLMVAQKLAIETAKGSQRKFEETFGEIIKLMRF